LIVLLLAICGKISAHPHETGLVSVIGTFESVEEVPDPCAEGRESVNEEGQETVCISMDQVFKATYMVREVISGNVGAGSRVTFTVADHYGFPEFARYKNALLFIQLNNGDPYLEKYQGFEVHETALGRWATCGYPRGADSESGDLEDVTFAHYVTFGSVGELNVASVARDFPSPVYEVRNGIIRCVKGWSLERLVKYVKEGVLAARGKSIE